MLIRQPWTCAALVCVILFCGLTPTARADGASAETSTDFQLALQEARRESTSGLALMGVGFGLATMGGLMGGLAHDDSGLLRSAGVGIGGIGGILVLPGAITAVYGAGHLSGLRLRSDFDTEETAARHGEIAGAVLFVGGLVMTGAGAGMAIAGLGSICFDYCGGNQGNAALFGVGIAMSVVGDLMWISGMFLWPWQAGRKRGIREARHAINLSPFGVKGTF